MAWETANIHVVETSEEFWGQSSKLVKPSYNFLRMQGGKAKISSGQGNESF